MFLTEFYRMYIFRNAEASVQRHFEEFFEEFFLFCIFFSAEVPILERIKRQDVDEDALEKQLCSDKGAGEWFRLETGKDKCRDVIQCTSSVSVFIYFS